MAVWKTVPDFGDEYAKTTVKVHEPSGARIAEVLYDAHDRNDNLVAPASEADGHGRWLGIEIDGTWQVLSWQHPRKSGGRTDYGFGCNKDHEPLATLEADLAHKAKLAGEAREVAESGDRGSANAQKMNDLMEEWRKIRAWHVPREAELWETFHGARHEFYAGREEEQAHNKAAKEQLIAETEAVLAERDFRHGSERMKALMDRWKQTPSAGRRDDQELWKKFNGTRNEFFAAQHENYEQRRGQQAEAATRKQALVEHAAQITAAKDYSRGAADEMKSLTDEWKAAGSAGHRRDEELWAQFRAAQQPFWDQRAIVRERSHADWEKRHAAWCERMEKVIEGKQRAVERAEDDINYLEFKKTTAETDEALRDIERQLADAERRRDDIQAEIADIRKEMAK